MTFPTVTAYSSWIKKQGLQYPPWLTLILMVLLNKKSTLESHPLVGTNKGPTAIDVFFTGGQRKTCNMQHAIIDRTGREHRFWFWREARKKGSINPE